MQEILPFLIAIVALIVFVNLLADKLKIAYPILMVLVGLIISAIPSIPDIHLDPDLVFFVLLPPLLFEASWAISFKGLVRFWRIIGSFSFLVVFFTAIAVALFANSFIPGFSLAMGFLLGAIVSPPDAVSAGAILRFVKIPKGVATVLEGESLFNDASSLIIFRFALIAIGTGQFIWSEAITSFLWMVIGGVGIGLLLAYVLVFLLRKLPTNAPSDIAMTLIAPYLFYWVAEELGYSGVMAVVTGGLYMSNRRLVFLTSQSRVRGYSFWESFVFILNGTVFFVIGLDLTEVADGLIQDGISIKTGIYYGILITLLIIFVRIVASFIALFATLVFRRNMLPKDFKLSKSLGMPFVLGWAGMRGVVTLAAASSIPMYLSTGEKFPERELILFISFTVIILTLFIQGLTLPIFLRKIKLRAITPGVSPAEQKKEIEKELTQFSIAYIQEKYKDQVDSDVFLAEKLKHLQQKLSPIAKGACTDEDKKLYIDVLESQRNFLIEKNKNFDIDEELIRKEVFAIDLEEEKVKTL